MAYVVRQHIPGFVDGVEPQTATVDTLAELLALPWVQQWTDDRGDPQGRTFRGWRRADDTLLALYGADEESWWVVAHAPAALLADLPAWEISAKGRERVERWNRGEG